MCQLITKENVLLSGVLQEDNCFFAANLWFWFQRFVMSISGQIHRKGGIMSEQYVCGHVCVCVYVRENDHYFVFVVVVQSPSHVHLWDPMDCSTPGFPVLHHLLEFAQTHVHWVGDVIQLSHSLSSLSFPFFRGTLVLFRGTLVLFHIPFSSEFFRLPWIWYCWFFRPLLAFFFPV